MKMNARRRRVLTTCTIDQMNAGRRGSLRGPLPEPSALSLPPPRSPERMHQSQQRGALAETSFPPDLPFFTGTFSPLSAPLATTIAPPPPPALPGSPPSSPTKPLPVILGNFSHLGGSSPPLRPSNHNCSGSISTTSISIPSLAIVASARTYSEPRSLVSEGELRSKDHTRTKTSSLSSLADIAEGTKLDDFQDHRLTTNSISSAGDSVDRTKNPVGLVGSKLDSPRSLVINDLMSESPVSTPPGSTPSSFLSLSPTNSTSCSSFGQRG